MLSRAAALITLGFLCASFIARADTHADDYNLDSVNLEDLLNLKTSVASKQEHTVQTSPGIVTLITSEEIRNSGARDLIDVLQLVPGMTFATDTEGVVSLAVRGNWAHEGKVLLLIDGEEMNEMFYGTIQLGHEYPVDSIGRVEVIRGPGSAIYGGHAELAVINVISKTAAELHGLELKGTYAQMRSATSMEDLGLGLGKTVAGDWNLTSYVSSGRGDRSDLNYTDKTGQSFNMKGNSSTKPSLINLGASNSHWNLRFIYDRYANEDRTAYGVNTPADVNMDFTSLLFGAKYLGQINSALSIVPELHFRRQEPWKSTDALSQSVAGLEYNKRADEVLARTTATMKFSSAFTGNLGAEVTNQVATDYTGTSTWANGKTQAFINRQAAFTELNWDSSLANFTLGARFQNQDGTGASFVPRFAAVKQFGDFYSKLLFSMGYRSPDFENIRANPQIRSETTETIEGELGYKISPQTLTTINVFHTTIHHPIVYDFTAGDNYYNFDATGTQGVELDFRNTRSWGYMDVNYSFYQPQSSHVSEYQVPDHSGTLLGIPAQKLTANGNVKIFNSDTRLNLGATYLSERYGYDWNGSAMAIQRFAPVTLVNFFVERRNLLVRGLDFGVGMHNLLNQNYRYIEPYPGGHPPQPAQSQEWISKITYRMDF